jgi:uncharacterized protein YggE
MKQIALTILLLTAAASIAAQAVQPSVSVVGEAQMKVSPDQVVFTFEIITANKSLAVAKRENDTRSAKTLLATKSFPISADDIQTDSLTISPQYTGPRDPRGERVLIGYEVTKRMLITLRELDKIDMFLAKAIEAGVNRVAAISIENSQMQKFQEQVRSMAVKNARAKASAYAAQLGQTIGRAYVIREEDADTPGYTSGTGSGSGRGSGTGYGDPNGKIETSTNPFVSQVTFALGQILIEEKVYVTFELKP